MGNFTLHWEQKIVQKGHPALSRPTQPVPIEAISGKEIQSLIADMHRILATQDDGVALAAPQIGADVQIFVVSPKVFPKMHSLERLTYINPTIIRSSKQMQEMQEGCLSVRGWYGETLRHVRSSVRAYDELGRVFTRDASGLLSQIFQHEIDHLKGILFDSHACDLYEVEIAENLTQ